MNNELRRALAIPMRTILDVRVCFDYCATLDDINRVIKKIPSKFGEFEVLLVSEEERYFIIQNFFEKDGELKSQAVSYDFYTCDKTCFY